MCQQSLTTIELYEAFSSQLIKAATKKGYALTTLITQLVSIISQCAHLFRFEHFRPWHLWHENSNTHILDLFFTQNHFFKYNPEF